MTVPARTSAPARGRAAASARRRDVMPTRGRDSGSSRGRDAGSSRGRDSGPQHGRSPAIARAYARRAQRAGAHRAAPDCVDAGRTPFVMLVMALLGAALVATLWLSTAATADSYHLQSARKDARNLTERSESLGRQVATLETAPELARRARELGMVPAGDVARLVVRPDGGVVLVGQPRRAIAPAPPPVVTPPPPPVVAPAPPPPVDLPAAAPPPAAPEAAVPEAAAPEAAAPAPAPAPTAPGRI